MIPSSLFSVNLTLNTLFARGILFLIFGVLMLIFTFQSAFAITTLLSILLIFLGVVILAGGISFPGKTGILPITLGILIIIFAILTLIKPEIFLAFIVYLIGIVAIIVGIEEIVAAKISTLPINRPMMIASGIIGIIFGILVICFSSNENITVFGVAVALTYIAGIVLVIIGIASLIEGFAMRRILKKQNS